MVSNFIPAAGHTQDAAIRDAYVDWLSGLEFHWYVTLAFNHAASVQGARTRFRAWIGRIDRRYLGKRWNKLPNDARTLACGAIENPTTNLHLHVLLKMPSKALHRPLADQIATFKKHWKVLEPAGAAHIQQITHDPRRVAGYVFKQLTQLGHIETCILLAPE